ncbi:MAG: hypothetical protein ACK4UN_21265, partial [Limisphaerales bacterium]
MRDVGTNGGKAAAFSFDLARSIVYMRQGNPDWIEQERDGKPPLRPGDLFFGNASHDPQPDWIDLSKVAIPQADEKQRLLANLIITMNSGRKLLPRFWYFPKDHKAAIVMTGDDHGNNGTAGRFEQYRAYSEPGGSVEDWETIRSTSYIFPSTPLTHAQAAAYHADGFEIGLHLDTDCKSYTAETFDTLFTEQIAQWKTKYPSLPPPVTHRIHCIAWAGYIVAPEAGLRHGIRLDVNYYYWPGEWVANRPGFFTGSGMPMRFASADGIAIDVYQAATQMTDESEQTYPEFVNALLDKALGPEGYYGAFVANMHTDVNPLPDSDSIVTAAIQRGVPVISARQLLTWIDARNGSAIKEINRSSASQTFSIQTDSQARGLRVMVPVPDGNRINEVEFNGTAISFK